MKRLAIFLFAIPFPSMAQTIDGTVFDPSGSVVPGARVMLAENYALKAETVSDAGGRFTFSGMQAGPYQILIHKDMFGLYRQGVLVREERPVRLNAILPLYRMQDLFTAQTAIAAPGEGKPEASKPPVGGKIEWPKVLRMPKTPYPESAAKAGISGAVLLLARVKTDGTVEILRTISSPDKELESAACDAITQARYVPMKLNGLPVEYETEITIDFRQPKK